MIRRLVCSGFLALCIASACQAEPTLLARGKLLAGAATGFDWPLGQDDADPGPAFALLGRYGLSSRWALESSLALNVPTDGESPTGSSVQAPRLLSAMLDALIRSRAYGFALSARFGLGVCDLSLPGDSNGGLRLAGAIGFGMEYGLGPLTAQLGPRLLVVENDGGTRKNLELRLGALYSFN